MRRKNWSAGKHDILAIHLLLEKYVWYCPNTQCLLNGQQWRKVWAVHTRTVWNLPISPSVTSGVRHFGEYWRLSSVLISSIMQHNKKFIYSTVFLETIFSSILIHFFKFLFDVVDDLTFSLKGISLPPLDGSTCFIFVVLQNINQITMDAFLI